MRIALLLATIAAASRALAGEIEFTEKGGLRFPGQYREWVFLSSGLGMTYGPAAPASAAAPPLFDTVFVNPSAWAKFKETGTWPEGTAFILEIRYSASQGSINKGGHFQTGVAAIEAAVKDTARFPKGWGYFSFGGGFAPVATESSAMGPNSTCQACHGANGAVDNTFTQFYPTAIEIARKKGTVKPTFKPFAASPAELFHQIRDSGDDTGLLLEQVRALDPNATALSPENLNRTAKALMEGGKSQRAVEVFAWLSARQPQSASARSAFAEALESSGRFGEARQASQQALQLLDTDTALSDDASRSRLRAALTARIERLGAK